jgi:hypothetical protein
MTYNLPSLIGPNQGELLTKGKIKAFVEAPAIIAVGKLNTVIWSVLTGLLLYVKTDFKKKDFGSSPAINEKY